MSHVHCQACHKAIEHNKNKPYKMAQELAPAPAPNGQVTFILRNVPICEACVNELERQQKEQQQAAAASKLIVPDFGKKLEVPQ